MMKSAVNYDSLLGLLQTFEKDYRLHKEMMNVVGESSLTGRHPFKKEKNKNKKMQHAGDQIKKSKSDQSQTEYFYYMK